MRERPEPFTTACTRRLIPLLAAAAAGVPAAVRADEPATAISTAAENPPTPQEFMASRGLVRYRGSWRTVQEIELIERADRINVAQKEWTGRLERLRKRLDAPAQADAAAEEIREISDPFAVPALAAAVTAEGQPRVRALYVEALSRIRAGDATAALVRVAVDHADAETRVLAVEQLLKIGPDAAAAAIATALGGDDNARTNRAAAALGQLGVSTVVAPLVDVLETEHVVVVPQGGPEGSTTATFTPSGGGLSVGGGAKRRTIRLQNQQVLEALVTLTGMNFGWNVDAWRGWLASRQSPPDFDPRRDR